MCLKEIINKGGSWVKEYSFYGKNLEGCLDESSKELNIPKDQLVYKVISDKKSLFKKTFNIIVYVESESPSSTYDKTENVVSDKNINGEEEKKSSKPNEKLGSVKVLGGELIIKDSEDKRAKPIIVIGEGVIVKVDGKEVSSRAAVTSENNIEIEFENLKAKRELNLSISEDKLECYISITYSPEVIYGLQDAEESNSITLDSKIVKKEHPPLFTEQEILEILKSKGVIYGYCKENIKICLSPEGAKEVLVARGDQVVPSENDIVEVLFKQSNTHDFELDDSGNVDFKSIGNISSVKKGDILCKRVLGKEGIPGKNVFGQVIAPKNRKEKDIVPKEGCELMDENTIVASMDGKPQVKGNYYSVHNIHKVMGDVDIKTGNIHFIGDVIVYGDVKEGMNIEAGNSILINSNVYRAVLKAGSDICIKGNVISSSILAGSNYVDLLKYTDCLEELADTLKSISSIVEQVKHNKFSVQNIPDGSLIKNIVDSKYRGFKGKVNEIFKQMQNLKDTQNKVFRIMNDKLSDAYFSNIKDYGELKHIEDLIREKLERMKGTEENMSNITLNYVQDSNIEGSGDIVIVGKGVYKSHITAMSNLYFVGNENSTARGGVLRAKKEISAKIVGSPTGVSTILAVPKDGHIYCNIAHLNTKFMVGEKEVVLDESYKNIHAYLNKDSELIVDKLKL